MSYNKFPGTYDADADVDVDALEANTLIVGGTLYAEDANSPINVTGQTSTTINLDTPSEQVIVIPSDLSVGFNTIQLNGDTSANYTHIDRSETETTGDTKFSTAFWHNAFSYKFTVNSANSIRFFSGHSSEQGYRGRKIGSQPTISQITFSDSNSQSRDGKARVYRRVMNI